MRWKAEQNSDVIPDRHGGGSDSSDSSVAVMVLVMAVSVIALGGSSSWGSLW